MPYGIMGSKTAQKAVQKQLGIKTKPKKVGKAVAKIGKKTLKKTGKAATAATKIGKKTLKRTGKAAKNLVKATPLYQVTKTKKKK